MTDRSAVADMLLAGRYRLERLVASGPCTTLWRAFDEVLTRPVAVKILDTPAAVPGCVDGPDAVNRFTTAATSVGRLAHPRIASTYDAGDDDGLPYIVTEWVEGSALADVVRDGPLRPTQAATIGVLATEAIVYAHATGVPHGDIDGFNVLVCLDGTVKLTDFGVASTLAENRRPAALEPLSATERDTRALAAIVYLALTGRSAYGTEHDLVAAPLRDGRLLSPREVRAGVPREIDAVVMRALDPDPRRGDPPITTPEELLEELSVLPGEDAGPEFVDPVDDVVVAHEPTRWLRVGLPLALVLLVVAAAVVIAVQVGRLPGRPGAAGTSSSDASLGQPAPVPLRPRSAIDFDPEGNPNRENPADVPFAFDGDPTTSWRTERYDSAALGNLKSGVGLLVDLGKPLDVREVRVTMVEPGATVQLRAGSANAATADGYGVVADAAGAGKSVSLVPRGGGAAQYWLLWITRLPRSAGGFRAQVAEVALVG